MVIVEYIKEAINENVLEDSEDPINPADPVTNTFILNL